MKRLKGVHQSKIASNSLVYTIDFVMQILVLSAYALIISRKLGPSGYGIFSSITAISIIGSVFSGWGCDQILIKNVSVAKESFKKYFGNGLVLILVTYPILLTILFTILYFLIPISEINILSLLLFISAELLFTKVIFFTKACFAVFERAKDQLIINTFTTATKLLFLLLALEFSASFTLDSWSIWYISSLLISAFFSIAYVIYHLGKPLLNFLLSEFILGMQFCIEQASLAGLKDIDKPIVVAMLGSEQGGYYSAAFKIIDAASSPVRGALYAVYIRYFEFNNKVHKEGIDFAFKVMPFLVFGSLIIGLLTYFFAWTLPFFIGNKYVPAVSMVRQLWLYPLLLGLLGTGVDLLRGIGHQLLRTYILIVSTLLSTPILYLFIVEFNIKGVVYAKIFGLSLTVLFTWWMIYKIKNHKNLLQV
jgi:O-antigen/teichoic acid export membrane protein